MKATKYSRRDILIFGTVMGLLLGTLACWGIWRDDFQWTSLRIVLGSLGGLVLVAGVLQPRVLAPLLGLWMVLTGFVGHIISLVFLTLLYFGVLFPIGAIRRLLGADPMGRKKAADGAGYWRSPDVDGRGKKGYEQQF